MVCDIVHIVRRTVKSHEIYLDRHLLWKHRYFRSCSKHFILAFLNWTLYVSRPSKVLFDLFGLLCVKTQGHRIKYLSSASVCLSKKFLGKQTEHQKSFSAAKGNVRGKKNNKLTQLISLYILCVCMPYIR